MKGLTKIRAGSGYDPIEDASYHEKWRRFTSDDWDPFPDYHEEQGCCDQYGCDRYDPAKDGRQEPGPDPLSGNAPGAARPGSQRAAR